MSILEGDTRPANPVRPRHSTVEHGIESTLFASRWLLAPVYVGLVAGLAIILVKFVQEVVELILHVAVASGDETIIGVLRLVDLSLMGSLVLMVMFAGYENFVSKFDQVDQHDRPSWMGHVDFSDLKLKLMGSIVAISAIKLLESFMNAGRLTDRELGWSVGIHMAFVVSGVLLAVMDRLPSKGHG